MPTFPPKTFVNIATMRFLWHEKYKLATGIKNHFKKFSQKSSNNEEFGIKGIKMFSWKCCRFFSKYTFSFILDISFANE